MPSRTCSRCSGAIVAKRGRYGFYTVHPASPSGKCPAGPATPRRRGMDAEQMAEYRMTAEYAAEVRAPNEPYEPPDRYPDE